MPFPIFISPLKHKVHSSHPPPSSLSNFVPHPQTTLQHVLLHFPAVPQKRPAAGEDKTTTSSKKQTAHKKKKISPPPVPADYVSQAKKCRQELDQTIKKDVGTNQGVKAYIERGMPQTENITIYARFLWKSHHEYNGGKTSWRLHMYDVVNDQPLEDLLPIYYDAYDDDKAKVDRDLATVSIWDDWDGISNCPEPCDVVKFKRFTGPRMYQGDVLQFSTRPEDMEF